MGMVVVQTSFVQTWVQDASFTGSCASKKARAPAERHRGGLSRARRRELARVLRGCVPEQGSLAGRFFELVSPVTPERTNASVDYGSKPGDRKPGPDERNAKVFSGPATPAIAQGTTLGLVPENPSLSGHTEVEPSSGSGFRPRTPTEVFGGLGVSWEELEHPRLGEKLSIFDRAAAEVGPKVWSRIVADDDVALDEQNTRVDAVDSTREVRPVGDFEIHPLYKDEAREMLVGRMRESRRAILRLQREIDDFPERLEKLIAEIDACTGRSDRQRRLDLLARGQRMWTRHHEAIDQISREELRMEEYLYAWGRLRCNEDFADVDNQEM